MTRKKKEQCGINGKECGDGFGFPSPKCPVWRAVKRNCPILNGINTASVRACESMKDSECEIYPWKVKEV